MLNSDFADNENQHDSVVGRNRHNQRNNRTQVRRNSQYQLLALLRNAYVELDVGHSFLYLMTRGE